MSLVIIYRYHRFSLSLSLNEIGVKFSLTPKLPNQSKQLVLKLHLKYIQIYESLFQKFSMIFVTISEELNYLFVFLSLPHFYIHTISTCTSYFDLIVGNFSVN